MSGYGELLEPGGSEGFDAAVVDGLGDAGLDGELGHDGNVVLEGDLLDVAVAEDGVLLAAVGALVVAHVLHKTQNRDVHHARHVDGLGDDHAHELLGAGDHDDAGDRQALEDRERHVARSGRHVDEHILNLFPLDVRPELGDGARDDGAAPDDGVGLVREQQVDAHQLDAGAGAAGIEEILAAHGAAVDAEGLRDRGAGDIRIKDGRLMAAALHLAGEQARDEALADAALAGDDGDDLIDSRAGTQVLQEGLGLGAGRAVAAAGGAVVGALFRHGCVGIMYIMHGNLTSVCFQMTLL